MVMDNHLEGTREAVRISSDRVLSLDDKILKGIDGVYETASPPPKYIIAEAKFGSSRLGKTKDGLQMSEDWILGGSRLEDAVGRDVAEQIIDEMVLNPENVQNLLVHIDKAGNVTESILDSFGKVVK
ncbi:cytosolic protein [Listeria booriae]|uniref:Cytosolic protein n=2 Tax=Listeria booriae TaxID=1552123 RepID=A0A7X1D744_9LIST|nr:cytosolic protein [Listeria booriae]